MTIRPNQIPPEVVEAAAKAIRDSCSCAMSCPADGHRTEARAAIAAAIAAWPDATMYGPHSSGHGPSRPQLVLPIQEARDE